MPDTSKPRPATGQNLLTVQNVPWPLAERPDPFVIPTLKRPLCAENSAHALVNGLSVKLGSLPHLFDVVELAHFRTENMDDDIACVDQHPITAG
jgi:hypothetical protein